MKFTEKHQQNKNKICFNTVFVFDNNLVSALKVYCLIMLILFYQYFINYRTKYITFIASIGFQIFVK